MSALRSLHWDKEIGRAAHVASSSFFSEYSCSICLKISGVGSLERVVSRRIEEGLPSFEWPRYRTKSSSLRRGSSAYAESSTVLVLPSPEPSIGVGAPSALGFTCGL